MRWREPDGASADDPAPQGTPALCWRAVAGPERVGEEDDNSSPFTACRRCHDESAAPAAVTCRNYYDPSQGTLFQQQRLQPKNRLVAMEVAA